MRRFAVLCAVAAAGFLTLGAVQLRDSGVDMKAVVADGDVPMLAAAPADPKGGVVVVHGFAGSARLMRGFADTLVRRGYVVVIPDLSGHGTNTRPLPPVGTSAAAAALDSDVDAAVEYLRRQYALPPERIALVGHSMGATAVTEYATHHPELAATVAISLGSAEDLPDDPARPRDLLVLTGGLEFAGFRNAAEAAVAKGHSAATIDGTEHISVLFADATHRETAQWIDQAMTGTPGSVRVHPRDRLSPAGFLLLGFALGFVPLAVLLLPVPAPTGSVPEPEPVAPDTAASASTGSVPEAAPIVPDTVASKEPMPWRFIVGGALAGVVAATMTAGYLPTDKLPLAVGGYTAAFFVVVGAALIAAWALSRRGSGYPGPAHGLGRLAVAGAILTLSAVAAIALPIHLGFTNAVPTGQRWWLLPVVVLAAGVLLFGVELLAGRWWVKAALLGMTTVSLTAAAVVGLAPGFIVLVIPLLAVLFAWHVAWSVVLDRRGAPPSFRALIGAILVAWPIAVTLPIVS